MATPQTYKKNLHILGRPQGVERREQIKEMITDKDVFLPKGVLPAFSPYRFLSSFLQ